MQERSGYQPQLDGLRALAVMIVLFYHAGADWISGGYIGVDVFFVLSGFLITRLLVTQLQDEGSIAFVQFYMRRIRRLFPAMLSTAVISFFIGFVLLSREQMDDFVRSIAAAMVSVSNILFWRESGYFEAAATAKPLLHTWSLSVEEQFYLIWPLALFILWRLGAKRAAMIGLALLSIISLIFGELLLKYDPAASFYLLPSRIVELGIGGLLVFLPRIKHARLQDAAMVVGVVLILHAGLTYTAETPFPGLNVALPCLGAALFIAGSSAPIAARPFTFGPVAWLGRISYSLYLVHWPIIVFYVAFTNRLPSSLLEIASLTALSILLGWLQYVLVEQRYRHPKEKNLLFVFNAVLIAGLIAFQCFLINHYSLIDWRLSESRNNWTSREWLIYERDTYCRNHAPNMDNKLVTCQNYRGKDKDLYLWGDSHALHLIAGLSEYYPDYNIYVMYTLGCNPQYGIVGVELDSSSYSSEQCAAYNRQVLDYLMTVRPGFVVLSNTKRLDVEVLARANYTIMDLLRAKGHKPVVIGDFMQPGVSLMACISVPDYIISDKMNEKRCQPVTEIVQAELAYNKQLAKLMPEAIMPDAVQCPDDKCNFYAGGKMIYRDSHHLSAEGSIKMIEKLRDQLPF